MGFPAIIATEERENARAPWRKATLVFGANAEAVAKKAVEIMVKVFIVDDDVCDQKIVIVGEWAVEGGGWISLAFQTFFWLSARALSRS